MSDSSYKITTSSRRKPALRRRVRPRVQPKLAQRSFDGTSQPQKNQATVNRSDSRITAPIPQKRRRPLNGQPVPKGKKILSTKEKVHSPQVRRVKVAAVAGYTPTGKKAVRVRKQPVPKRVAVRRRSRLKPVARNFLYALRLLIVGVGISAIVGTALHVMDPAVNVSSTSSANPTSPPTQAGAVNSPTVLTQEIISLKAAIQTLVSANPRLTPGVFVLDLTNGSYVDINGGAKFSAASTIKTPILIAFFQEVDAGRVRLDETMTMKQEFVAGGSGDMQYKPVGTKYTALEVAAKMMSISDNTATNMLIDRLGGIENLNQRFLSWGLRNTQISNILPDLEGTNTTTPKELSQLMTMLNKGGLVSMVSRDRIFDIMRQTVRDTMLPAGIGENAKIAHKTGDIRSMIGDAGLVDLPTGKRYAIAVMVQRPDNDPQAEQLVASISRTVYQQLSQAATPQNTSVPITPTPNSYNPNIPNTNIPNTTIPSSNIPSQNQILNPAFNSTTYRNPAISPQMTTPGYRTYQTPVVTPQYYYPYQR